MKLLSNESLVEAYSVARKENLDKDFIELLFKEIKHRNINLDDIKVDVIKAFEFSN
ncbi:sporulation histidine kinase inhibitor Sda [Litchfieldia alkalitelluris]|uniref:sporulation histidine kinase inhibitor Sda n=1 Tax=Litchfieldia alkalitelluris TaxID=304268 RepID=UPI001116AF9B|nr:sporulation histidine kinase inhibitor Sda [Litchfieldia alkalitelluris]